MSILFNKKALPEFIRVTGISFPVLPDIDFNETKVPRRYGNIDNGVTFGGKPIKVEITLVREKTKNIHTQADELKAWLKGDNWKPSQLTFEEQPLQYVLARVVNNVEIEDLFIHGTASIDFHASDPIKYDVTPIVTSSVTGAVTSVYAGTESTPSVITVTVKADCNNLNIKHTQSKFNIRLLGAFKANSVVIVDSNKKVVKVDGVVTMKLLDFTSRWIYLVAGTNTITVTSENSAALNTVKLEYKKAN